MSKRKFPIEDAEVVYQNSWSRVVKTICSDDRSKTKEIYTTDFGARAGVIFVKNSEILLTQQPRLLAGKKVWELPGGKVDEEETFHEGATREGLEETGLLCQELEPLISYQQGLDTVFNPTEIFVCRRFAQSLQKLSHETESLRWVDIRQAKKMIEDEIIIDSFSIIGILSFMLRNE